MSLKKLLILVTALALVGVCMIGLTTAYLTSTSDPLTNVLEASKTKVDGDEPSWDPDDPHPLIPGTVYAKDPTATLKKGSVPSYVFIEVTATDELLAVLDSTPTNKVSYPAYNTTDWTLVNTTKAPENTKVYVYTGTLLDGIETVAADDIQLPALFDQIKILATATDDELKAALGTSGTETEIKVVMKSCQKLGFDTALAAYDTALAPAPVEEAPAE